METQKRNVAEFNQDVAENGGYKYTTNASYSSVVANRRMSEAAFACIPPGITSLIDIGCGDGTYTGELVKRFPQVEIIGVDPATEAVNRAQQMVPSAKFQVADILVPATLPPRVFDVGIIRGVIHHLPDGIAGINNAARICKTLIIIEPNGNNPVLKWIEKHSQYHIQHQEQSFSSADLRRWCREAGYRKVEHRFVNFIPMFFPTFPARVIHFFQPLCERIYPLAKYFSGQIVLTCSDFTPPPATAAKTP